MIELHRDSKAKHTMWIITYTDQEGFHRQLCLPEEDMAELFRIWTMMHLI